MTYSSGLPILYLVAFFSLFITYHTDKFLMLRYFKVANQFTEANSRAVVSILPWAAIFHFIVGYFVYSYPNIMSSNQSKDVGSVGSKSKSHYFSNERFGQAHVLVFIIAFAVVILMLIFEKPIVALLSIIMKYINIGTHKLWLAIRCKE
jgi:hypothetical protein